MKEASLILVSLINVFILTRYIYLIHKKKIQPALSMWVFFSIAVGMSLLTYMKSGEFSLKDNILNSTDLILVVTVSVAIYFQGDKNSRFTGFDKLLFVLVGIIVGFWLFTKEHFISNLLIQAILVIAYIPVVRKMYSSKKNTEPFSVWIALMIAPLISMISGKGDLAYIYALRAIVCTATLLILMTRISLRYPGNKNGSVSEIQTRPV